MPRGINIVSIQPYATTGSFELMDCIGVWQGATILSVKVNKWRHSSSLFNQFNAPKRPTPHPNKQREAKQSCKNVFISSLKEMKYSSWNIAQIILCFAFFPSIKTFKNFRSWDQAKASGNIHSHRRYSSFSENPPRLTKSNLPARLCHTS